DVGEGAKGDRNGFSNAVTSFIYRGPRVPASPRRPFAPSLLTVDQQHCLEHFQRIGCQRRLDLKSLYRSWNQSTYSRIAQRRDVHRTSGRGGRAYSRVIRRVHRGDVLKRRRPRARTKQCSTKRRKEIRIGHDHQYPAAPGGVHQCWHERGIQMKSQKPLVIGPRQMLQLVEVIIGGNKVVHSLEQSRPSLGRFMEPLYQNRMRTYAQPAGYLSRKQIDLLVVAFHYADLYRLQRGAVNKAAHQPAVLFRSQLQSRGLRNVRLDQVEHRAAISLIQPDALDAAHVRPRART